ncbi:hypothetical protein CC80DRAFT_492915 [Byssothecium circinans]|uniref:Uncharacterized protein n=1 Tax=Byssothecium circinans TaxID=147558 RepID=A0A6A5U4F8_9PLEO|nr:hypothetical protein CC80DRAFT_492915 [Byssothecium circinans]
MRLSKKNGNFRLVYPHQSTHHQSHICLTPPPAYPSQQNIPSSRLLRIPSGA